MPKIADRLEDDEILLRRILDKDEQYKPESQSIFYGAFKPTSIDDEGISLTRAKSETHPEFLDDQEFGLQGRNPAGYYIAWFRLTDLVAENIVVQPSPEPSDPGHVHLPDLWYDNRRDTSAIELMRKMASLRFKVTGPFKQP